MRARRRIHMLAATAATVMALAACSLGDTDTSAGGSADGSGGSDGSSDSDGRTLVAGTGTVPHLNPQIIVSPSVNAAAGGMLETLVRMNDSYELVPWLAREWEISDDGRTVTLMLEEDVSWHDGEPFTSEDVKFNFEEVMQYQSYGGALTESVDSVEVPDDHTVVVNLSQPYGPFMEVLTQQYLLPKHIYEGTDVLENPANMEPVGTGAFVFESFSEGQEVTMTANPDYWGGEVGVDRMVYVIMKDTNATALAMLAGEIHMGGAGQGMLDQIEADENLDVTQNGQLGRQFIFTMNNDMEELSDPAVRQLVYSAIDRAQVAEIALPGISVAAASMYPEELNWIEPGVDYREEFAYDVDAINTGLDEAGYPRGDDGFRFTIRLHFMSTTAESRAVAEVMKSSMAEVGINLDLNGEDVNVFTENVYQKRDFDTAIVEATLGVDPSLGITRWYECNPEKANAQNPSGVCDEELQEAADNALRTAGQDERAEYFRTIQDRAAELMISAPIVFHTARSVFNTTLWNGLGSEDHLVGTDWTTVTPNE
ncbi:ABC transporter substrate-binding protein [Phytoactinopolyspora endophytica]|uniref:ABC transporter substrate-binding protein n=1 Tax=Phytoactinopolyspora endophytica TaxID=1642495 RepID=UPI00101C69EC|nr:ABC transporter substrate-binding protein [Phytoactinopolyspora endophytica]